MLAIAGRHSEAIAEITLAQKLDPHSAVISSAKGMIHFYARQYREGINECEKALKIDTGFVPAHKIMRWTFQGANDYAGAAIAFQKEKNFSGSAGSAGWLVIEAQVEALGGNSEKARGLLEKGLANDFVRENPMAFGYEIALAYTALDEREKALDWLEKAEAVNNHSFNFIEVDPRLDNIREDPRFAALIKKLKNLQITQVAGYQNIEGVVRQTR
jgi:tetratricopeptide (TPR) repeat protein